MNSIVEARVRHFLANQYHCTPPEANTVATVMRSIARAAGYALDERFADAGLAAGPEARVASRIVGRALGEYGDETPEFAIRQQIDAWRRTHAPTTG